MSIKGAPVGIFNLTAQATVGGQTIVLNRDCAVPPNYTTTISGRVTREAESKGVKYIQVNFYDASGAAVAGVLTGDNGVFRAGVPATVKSVSIKSDTVPAPPFYKSFVYKSKVYTMDASTCPLKLTIASGTNNPLDNMGIFKQEDGPPPPPDGCKP
jgi:hypothetical protein